jgi:hypothetical protein
MKLQKILLLKLIVVIVTLFIVHPGFSQVKSEEIISFSGAIDSIPKDPKFIVVNERRVFISSNTTIASEKGSILKMNDLKIRLHVAIEGVQKPDGIYAKKITVMKSPQIKP